MIEQTHPDYEPYPDYEFLNKPSEATAEVIKDFEAFWIKLDYSPPGFAPGGYIKEVCKEVALQAYLQALKDNCKRS